MQQDERQGGFVGAMIKTKRLREEKRHDILWV